ncbi:phasin family protein [Ottowia pentelensis]|uniref:Phasin family protein n=1 Tax=Ottowia pentelensis TaxID=511108 RepID=A0ABV6PR56_9BURK
MATPSPKSRNKASSAKPPNAVQEPAHNIWLAGLGALASAQANAQSEGTKAFEALVKQGMEMQERSQALAKQQWAEAAQRIGELTTGASGSTGSWDRLGGIFEGRVARALANLGMPSTEEIKQLTRRVEALERALQPSGTVGPEAANTVTPKPRRNARRAS